MTENYIDGIINEVHTLEDCLKKGSKDDFPRLTKENDSYWKRYLDLKGEFKDYPVEMGALIKIYRNMDAGCRRKHKGN